MYVCVNKREDGKPDCAHQNAQLIRDQLKQYVKDHGLKSQVRITQTGCQDLCSQGPNIHIMPQNLWLSQVDIEDIPEIIKQYIHLEKKNTEAP